MCTINMLQICVSCFGAILQLQPEAVEAGGELMSREVSNFLTLSNPAHKTTLRPLDQKTLLKDSAMKMDSKTSLFNCFQIKDFIDSNRSTSHKQNNGEKGWWLSDLLYLRWPSIVEYLYLHLYLYLYDHKKKTKKEKRVLIIRPALFEVAEHGRVVGCGTDSLNNCL